MSQLSPVDPAHQPRAPAPAKIPPRRPQWGWLVLGAAIGVAGAAAYAIWQPHGSPAGNEEGRQAAADRTSVPAGQTAIGEGPLPAPDLSLPLPETAAALIAEANQLARWLVARFPDDPDSLEILARVQFWQGKTDEALASWQSCLERKPDYAHAYHGMGMLAARQGDHAKAAELYSKALEIAPQAPQPLFELATSLVALGKPAQAIPLLEQSARRSANPAPAYAKLADLCLRANDDEKAAKYAGLLAEVAPEVSNARYVLATVCARRGDAQQAKEHLAKFQELREKEKTVKKQERDEVQDDVNKMRLAVSAAYAMAGRACLGRQEAGLAEKLWRRGAALAPDDVECRELLAGLYRSSGRVREAADVFEQLVRILPRHAGYWMELGRLQAEQNRLEQAQRALRKVCELTPLAPDGYAALARLCLHARRDPHEAVKLARTAVRLQPTPAHYALLATACERAGDAQGAAEAARQGGLERPSQAPAQKTAPAGAEKP